MNKKEILRMTGLTEKEFYRKYPTKESFMKEYGGKINSYATGSYTAKDAAAGKDLGKPGKNFAKIANKAAERYGSKEAGNRVAGAILAKLRAQGNGGYYAKGGSPTPTPTGDIFDMMGMPYVNAYPGGSYTRRNTNTPYLSFSTTQTPYNQSFINSLPLGSDVADVTSGRYSIQGGMPIGLRKSTYLTGEAGIERGLSRDVATKTVNPYGQVSNFSMTPWEETTRPYGSIGLDFQNNRAGQFNKGFTIDQSSGGFGLSYGNNIVSPYAEVNPRVAFNFGSPRRSNQPMTAAVGVDARLRPFYEGKTENTFGEMNTGASYATPYLGMSGRFPGGLELGAKGGYNIMADRPEYGFSLTKKFQDGGYADDEISEANSYDNWLKKKREDETISSYGMGGVPRYGLGDIIPGVGDVLLGTLDTTLAGLGGQDIIGDKQYSDTGFGRTMKDVSHYGSAVTESLLPTVASYIPGVGQIIAPALNAVQLGVSALTPEDEERLQSESGRNAAMLGMGLDVAGAITSLGTGGAKAATTSAKLAKAAKVANTVSDIAKGAAAAKNVYDVASSDNASVGDWIGAAAGAAGAGSGFAKEGSELSKVLSKGSKFGKMAQTGYNVGETLDKTGNLDMASTLGLAADITNTAAGKDTKAGTLFDIGSLGARTYQASKAGQPALATGLSAAGSALKMAPTASQAFKRKMPKNSPFGVPSDMEENTEYNNMLSGGTEYLRDGGYPGMNNFSKFANGGTVMGNIERNELTVVPGQYGAGGSPKVVADYSNFPSHPEDGSLDHEATIPLPYSEENPYFIIPKKYRNKALRADKLEMEALTKKISYEKEKNEARQMTKAMNAYERFIKKYGDVIADASGYNESMEMEEDMYKCGGSVYGCGGKVMKYADGDITMDRSDYRSAFKQNLLEDDNLYKGWRKDFRKAWNEDKNKIYNTESGEWVDKPTDINEGLKNYRRRNRKEARDARNAANTTDPNAPKDPNATNAPKESWLNRNAETLSTIGTFVPALYNFGMSFTKPATMPDLTVNEQIEPRFMSSDAQRQLIRNAAATDRYAARRAAGSSPEFLSYLTSNVNKRNLAEALMEEQTRNKNQEIQMLADKANLENRFRNAELRAGKYAFDEQSKAATRAFRAEAASNLGAAADQWRQSTMYKKYVYPNMLSGSPYIVGPDGTLIMNPASKSDPCASFGKKWDPATQKCV